MECTMLPTRLSSRSDIMGGVANENRSLSLSLSLLSPPPPALSLTSRSDIRGLLLGTLGSVVAELTAHDFGANDQHNSFKYLIALN